MLQRRRWLLSVLALLASMLAVSATAVAVTRSRSGDTIGVRSAPPRSPAQPQSAPSPGSPPAAVPESVVSPPPSGEALIDVAVATLWVEPGLARPIDDPSVTNPVDIERWVSTMTVADKLWLVGRLATQAIQGDRVTVVDENGTWTKVVVADQPSSLDSRGYPGWLPTVQLSRRPAGPAAAATGSRAGPTTGDDLIRSAQAFTGVPYLWAGITPLSFDCSGLTWAVYRAHEIVIPRDADDQAGAGSPVDPSALQPGDLLFYASGPGRDTVHHVAMYVGNGRMIQAPATGRVVETVPVDTPEFARQFWGARRYLSP